MVIKVEKEVNSNTLLLVYLMGLYIALIWLFVANAGQKLQRNWRNLVIKFEKELFGENGGAFIQASKEVKEGNSLLVSITTSLKLMPLGFLVAWIWLIVINSTFGEGKR